MAPSPKSNPKLRPDADTPDRTPDARTRLREAATHLVARTGPAASVRAIAKRAGLTEGALYRHFENRNDLLASVFDEIIEPMVDEKRNLVAMRAPVQDRLREWVRSTYAGFDRDPDAFAYVFLTDHDFPKEHTRFSGLQSALLRELIAQGRQAGDLHDISDELAATMFVGLLLSVPIRVRAGTLPRPASQYVDEVARAVWLTLGRDPGPSV
jgi:AcrR family transcriptional regulator